MNFSQLRNYLRFRNARESRDSILVTDILFPNRYAMWRIAETTSFMEEKSADFLVFRTDSYAGITFEVDYEEMIIRKGFEGYNIQIFDPKYNFMNRYNSRIDGRKFNGKINASYLISKHLDFNINRYAIAYHMFLMCYEKFNHNFFFPKERQGIHLYPGGGHVGPKSLKSVDRRTKVIATHPKTSKALRELGHQRFIECLGGSFLTRNDSPFPNKSRNENTLRVAFASMGSGVEKGSREYENLAQRFLQSHPNSNVEFVSIGKEPLNATIKHYSPMSMGELLDFYFEKIDIMVSIDTGIAFNGWPLGMEAALCGCVLTSTDPENASVYYNLPKNALFLFNKDKLDELIAFIHRLDLDRKMLLERSILCQSTIQAFLSYDNQQKRIFDFLGI